MSFRRILIAVDNGPIAAHAADVGTELARSLGAEVAFIHAIDPSLSVAPEGGVAAGELITLAQQDGKALLDGFRKRLSPPLSALEFLPRGKPAGEIIKAAKEWPADLIVIGSHGRGGVQRALFGSVADAVMQHTPCPVLVIRASE